MVALGKLHNSPEPQCLHGENPGIGSHLTGSLCQDQMEMPESQQAPYKGEKCELFLPPTLLGLPHWSSLPIPSPSPLMGYSTQLLTPPVSSTLRLSGPCSTCEEINVSFMHEEAASLPLGWLTHTQQAPGGNMATVLTEHVCEAREEGKGEGEGRNEQFRAT